MLSERVSRLLRRRVRERANGLCEYCQASANFASASFHCEHIIPRKVGGKNALGDRPRPKGRGFRKVMRKHLWLQTTLRLI